MLPGANLVAENWDDHISQGLPAGVPQVLGPSGHA